MAPFTITLVTNDSIATLKFYCYFCKPKTESLRMDFDPYLDITVVLALLTLRLFICPYLVPNEPK